MSMLKDQCVSVTDLRTKTKDCLQNLEKEPKYVFLNNRPVAVLIDINEYEEHFVKPSLVELSDDEVDVELKNRAAKARMSKKSDLLNL